MSDAAAGPPESVAVRRAGGRLTVEIARPEKRNALGRDVLAGLKASFESYADDPDVKVAVLTGSGAKSFAAGGDLKELSSVRTREDAAEMSRATRAVLDAVRRFPVPVVAALNGDALGGGAELAIACDMRVAAAHARIGFVQGRLAITTAWGGGADLQELVGPSRALALLTSGALLSAADALGRGLVDSVAEPGEPLDAAVERSLEPMLRMPRQVLAAYKAMRIAKRSGASRDELERIETEHFAQAWIHDDHWRAADAILTRSAS